MEFKEDTYSVIEDDRIYAVTLVKRGNITRNITVRILPISGTASGEWSS